MIPLAIAGNRIERQGLDPTGRTGPFTCAEAGETQKLRVKVLLRRCVTTITLPSALAA